MTSEQPLEENERKNVYIYIYIPHGQKKKMMDERTDKRFNNKLSFSSSPVVLLRLYMYAAMLCYQPRETESDRRRIPSQQHSAAYKFSPFIFLLCCARQQRPEDFVRRRRRSREFPRFSFSLHFYSFIIPHTQVFPFYTHSIIVKVEKNTKNPMNFPRDDEL